MCPLWALALVLALAEGAGKLGWAGRPGTATAGRMGHGVHAAGCWLRRSAATGGAHWATHTGQHTLGMGCCPGHKVLVPAPLFACCRVLSVVWSFARLWLWLASLAGIMAAASAHQVCKASNVILAWISLSSFPVLDYSCPAITVEYDQALLPLLTFYQAALMNVARLPCYCPRSYLCVCTSMCAEPRNCRMRLGQQVVPRMFAVAICCRQQHGIR